MRLNPRLAALLVSALVLTVGLAACGGSDDSDSTGGGGDAGGGGGGTTVTVGDQPTLFNLPFYIAQEQGYFADEGVDVKLTQVAEVTAPLISGDIDIATIAPDTSILSADAGKPLPVLVAQQQHNSLALVIAKDLYTPDMGRPYPQNVEALPQGIKIGTTVRSGGGEVFLQSILRGAGLEEGSDFSIVTLGPGPGIVAGLKSGKVDAAMLFPPFDAAVVDDGTAEYVDQEGLGEGPEDLLARYGQSVIASPSFVDGDPKAAKAIVGGVTKGAEFLREAVAGEDKQALSEIDAVATKYAGLTDEAGLEASIETIAKLAEPQVECSRLETQAELLVEVGTVDSVPDCADLTFSGITPE